MKQLNKPLIIITGASSGIGAATAKVFDAAGHPLLLLARRLDLLKKLDCSNAICQQADVTDFSKLQDIITNNIPCHMTVGCLINNAGIIEMGKFTETDIEKEKNMVDINLMGIINCVKIILPIMQKQNFGTVINISSIADRVSVYNASVYAATKAAIKSLTESWRRGNFDKNIRFCNLAPGYIDTPIWDPYKHNEKYTRLESENALITAEQFAEMILWVYQQPQHINIRDMVVTPTSSEI